MTKPFLIGGASMPRSGHHFLHRILSNYFGDEFGYCSYYSPWAQDFFSECCKNIPCSKYKDTSLSVFFQKSHDFHLTDPVDSADLNIVQIREPIARLFSNFQLHVNTNPKRDDLTHFRQFALKEYYYYVAFWHKWVVNPSDQRMILSYDALNSQPFETIASIVRATGVDLNEKHLLDVLAEQENHSGGGSKFVPKDIRKHKYYNEAWAIQYAQRVSDACDGYEKYCRMHDATSVSRPVA